MKNRMILAAAFFCTTGLALAQIQAGIAVGPGGDSFHLAIGSYYHAPPDQVTVAQQQHIPDEEQPVVFFVANQVHVAPGVIINLRAGGMSWVDIFHRYKLSPRVLYVPFHGRAAAPYAGFYAYYNGHGRGKVRLADADIINMVNLKFATEYYHRTPEEVMGLRAGGRSYADIHDQYHRGPGPGPGPDDHRDHRDDDHHDDHHDDRGDGGNWQH